ncbi:non-specific serine/threonine protein kinase [Salvia divinorum]|uniref:Non-specific serine/threonine protein kinase n=1 Tax=Salvia divinorum TaxID=28513 RepID=A0ABD1GQ50_SALDI
MRSPLFGGRRSGSDGGTPVNLSHSVSTSTFSSASTTTSRRSAAAAAVGTRNPFTAAARSIADALVACFTPPEPDTNSTNTFNDSSASSSGSRQRRNSNQSIYGSTNSSTHRREPGSMKFTIQEILKATKNFSPTLKIGQGGFGTVYKGHLEDGTIVAIKRAKKITYDKHLGVEFQSEVRTLAKVEHQNLVRCYGFLEHGDERILVVEYVANGTLREHLDCLNGNILDFASRLDVAIDVAHAVTYLHMYTDHPIIHRDIKSSNILLTENLRAKVADFGFARLAADKLITGRRPIEPKREVKERLTARWAAKKFANGDGIMALDPRVVRSPANTFALEKIFELALQCLAPHRKNRPSMRKCAEVLWGIRKDYKEKFVSDVIHE